MATVWEVADAVRENERRRIEAGANRRYTVVGIALCPPERSGAAWETCEVAEWNGYEYAGERIVHYPDCECDCEDDDGPSSKEYISGEERRNYERHATFGDALAALERRVGELVIGGQQ